ncbi:LLM class flavin-dependent oxidoreductase, partial [bacterium]|nr:LLM class flavin-dependent oxidoreductase [bacterium]
PINTVEWAMEQIKIGAKRGNRSLDSFMMTNRLPFSVSNDREKAREAVKSLVIPRVAYANAKTHELSGVDLDSIARLKAAVGDGYSASTDLVTDDMVTLFANAGTPDELIERLALNQKQGVKQYIFGPPFGPNIKEAFRLLEEKILPALL